MVGLHSILHNDAGRIIGTTILPWMGCWTLTGCPRHFVVMSLILFDIIFLCTLVDKDKVLLLANLFA